MNPQYLFEFPCPSHIWNLREHYTTSLVFPKHVAALVEEFFFELEDGSNGVNTQMWFLLMLSEGAIDIWMKETKSYTMEMMDEAIRFINPQYLCKFPCPFHIWDLPEHYTTSLVFSKHIVALVEEFFLELEDESKSSR